MMKPVAIASRREASAQTTNECPNPASSFNKEGNTTKLIDFRVEARTVLD
jgi:hypothetical protein